MNDEMAEMKFRMIVKHIAPRLTEEQTRQVVAAFRYVRPLVEEEINTEGAQ